MNYLKTVPAKSEKKRTKINFLLVFIQLSPEVLFNTADIKCCNTMNEKLKDTLKNLSKPFDSQSKNTFVSVYLNREQDKQYLSSRIPLCTKLLDNKEQENFEKTVQMINDFLSKDKSPYVAVFASAKYDFFVHIVLPQPIMNSFTVDSSPYIRPLARLIDEYDSFTLLLLNSNEANIFSVSMGQPEIKDHLSKDIINHHKKGGWSQARFARRRKGAIKDFFKEVQEALSLNVEESIIIAGPGIEKINFKNSLPKNLKEKVVEILDVDMDEKEKLFENSLEKISQYKQKQSHVLIEELRKEILTDGLAVYGIQDTLNAVIQGQIDILLIEKDYKLKGCLCEHCQLLKAGPIQDCPVCGGPTTEADTIEEIIEFAKRTNASIEFSDDEYLSALGHVAGLLRFK